ncbi:ATP-grasp domain-containing protein [bacterium]|nr:ATP-grasp domain-containing protein [bacterium]MBP9810929.1 ATP-grasp domain-containing protein [bacterium]
METSQLKRDWRHWTIAVTGVNAHAENPGPGMAVARCLVEHPEFKGRVIGLAYDALDAGLYARQYFAASYLLPYPSGGDEVLLERLMGIHDYEQIDAIIPCLDSELPNFIRLRGELAQNGIKMLIPSRDQFTLRAKDHLVELCQSVDIPVPRTKVLSDPSFFDRVASAGHSDEGWQYPLVLKGIFYDATIVSNAVEAKSVFCKLITKWGYPCLVQEVIKGDELNLAGLGDGAGNLAGHVTMRKRAITEKGKAWAGVTIIDEAMLETAQRLVKALSWRGPLEVEAIRGEDGRIYLIEINPRFPSWIYLSQAVNRNLPIAVLKLLDKHTDLGLAAPRSGYFFIRHAQELVLDLPEFESVLVNGRSGPLQNAELRAIKEKSA